jgi:hypothetical protein
MEVGSIKTNVTLNAALHTNNSKLSLQQFKLVLTVIICLFLVFLGLFIYNLIKCYLPVITNDIDAKQENKKEHTDNKLEFV